MPLFILLLFVVFLTTSGTKSIQSELLQKSKRMQYLSMSNIFLKTLTLLRLQKKHSYMTQKETK
jgi:integral membrane sensor domain MASE1